MIMTGFIGSHCPYNMVTGSVHVTYGINNFVINTFVFEPEAALVQNHISVQNHSIFKAATFDKTDGFQIIDLIFFAKRAAGRNFFGKTLRRDFSLNS